MTDEKIRETHRRYAKVAPMLSGKARNAIYDCYMQGVNHDGHTWVTWTDVERLICDLKDIEEESKG